MKITIFSLGTRGDIQPLVALGRGLERAGDTVRIAAFADSEALIRSHGLDFAPLLGDMGEQLRTEHGKTLQQSDNNIVRALRAMSENFRTLTAMPGYWDAVGAAASGADLLIYSPTGIHGYHLAEKMGIPSMLASPFPFIGRTRESPNPYVTPKTSLTPIGNWLSHLLFEQIAWLPFQGTFNAWRTQVLELPPVPRTGPYGTMQRSPILYGFSPTVFPRPGDWADHLHVTGYWFLDRPDDWQPPQELLNFLADGPPPVYIGFGSMTDPGPGNALAMAVEALRQTDQRGIVLTDPGSALAASLPPHLFPIGYIPFDWLFRHVSVAVHHGGSGTTASALRAGVPSIIVPFLNDQFIWARQVFRLGAGPRPIPRRQLAPHLLADALRAATADDRMRAAALRVRERMKNERGVEAAVQVVKVYAEQAVRT